MSGLWGSLLLGSALSLAVCSAVATQSLILGAPEGGWFYGYLGTFSIRPVGAALIVTALCTALLLAARPWMRSREWPLVFAWIATAVALQALLRSLTPVTLEAIFLSDGANSFYSVTQKHDALTVLSAFEDVRAGAPLHAQSNMPGKLMLLYALQTISPRTDVLPWLIVLLSNAGGALMYLFVRDLFDDREMALYSLVLYLFVPAKLFFFPLMNTVTPVVVLACACLLLRWLQIGRPVYAALFGAALYGLVFFEPLPLVIGLLFGALVARAWRLGTFPATRLAAHALVASMTFAGCHAAMLLVFGFDLVDAFRQLAAHAVEFNAEARRPYAIWVRENLWEFIFGVGLCQFVVFFAAVADGLDGPGQWMARLARPITLLCAGLLGVLVATDLIGINRGEVVRLWIFLACLFQIPAAYVCTRVRNRAAIVLVLGTTVLQAAIGTAMIGFVIVR